MKNIYVSIILMMLFCFLMGCQEDSAKEDKIPLAIQQIKGDTKLAYDYKVDSLQFSGVIGGAGVKGSVNSLSKDAIYGYYNYDGYLDTLQLIGQWKDSLSISLKELHNKKLLGEITIKRDDIETGLFVGDRYEAGGKLGDSETVVLSFNDLINRR